MIKIKIYHFTIKIQDKGPNNSLTNLLIMQKKENQMFLRQEELVNGLQMSSKSFQPLTCYQISDKGKELVKRISRKEKEAVHEFVYARGTRELLSAQWDGRNYYLVSSSGYRRKSNIKDVSYVSSAYIPQYI